MRVRESGMPEEEMWQTFFSPRRTLDLLGLKRETRHAVDFGCGYGTFTIPAAQIITGTVHALDIEAARIEETKRRAVGEGLTNIKFYLRDFVAEGTGLPGSMVGYVMLFNILHAENPLQLLREAYRIMDDGGKLGIMHWNYDSKTPRGPSMAIRPKPEDCQRWSEEAGFAILAAHVELPPYHYGIIAQKDARRERPTSSPPSARNPR
jgi:SAM-dependent methyltransferase